MHTRLGSRKHFSTQRSACPCMQQIVCVITPSIFFLDTNTTPLGVSWVHQPGSHDLIQEERHKPEVFFFFIRSWNDKLSYTGTPKSYFVTLPYIAAAEGGSPPALFDCVVPLCWT